MIIKYCKNCKKRFRARRQTSKYCSTECMHKFTAPLISKARKGMKFTEEHKANLRKNHTRPMLGKKFSKEHRTKISLAKIGNKNPAWKGGRMINYAGYINILAKTHPANNKGYVLEHRLIVEKQIGRFLKPTEDCHHINGNKTDNRPENLYLFPNKSLHRKCHIHKWVLISNII